MSFGHVLLFQLAVPSEIPGYVLGLAGCRFRTYVAAMVLGELPFAIGAVYLGESFLQRNYILLLATGIGGAAFSWMVDGDDVTTGPVPHHRNLSRSTPTVEA